MNCWKPSKRAPGRAPGNQQPSQSSNRLEGSTTRGDLALDTLPTAQQAFLRGCLLGDGWLGLQRGKYVHLRIGHCAAQRSWLEWKAARINKILGKERQILGPYMQSSGQVKEKLYESYLYTVDDHGLFLPWFSRWYEPVGTRYRQLLDADFLSGLGLQELAILWCDDGSITSTERFTRHRLKSGDERLYPYIEAKGSIAKCAFTRQENELLAAWIESLTGVRFRIDRSSGYIRLGCNKKALREFIPQISPFVPECMAYKVDLSHCRIRQGEAPTSARHP